MMTDDAVRLREFWNRRYSEFTLSESGWLGAGERLNERLYACKRQALRRALASLGLTTDARWSVLDAGCGQGHFARFYRQEYPAASYVGIDISEKAVDHLRRSMEGIEFHAVNLCQWDDPAGRTFDVVQCFDVLFLILDDDAAARALAALARRIQPRGALLVSMPLPDITVERSDYLRYRSRSYWQNEIAALGLRIVAERPIYYWLPTAGPTNTYLRYAMTRLGPDALYAVDRAALALGVPRPASSGIDNQTRLLTIQRT
jgi:SAM-dependent methyltransferase